MLIRAFRRSYIIQYVLLFMLSVLLFLPAIIGNHPHEVIKYELVAPGWALLLNLVGGNALTLIVMQVVVFILSAVFLNVTLEKYDLTPKNTLTPAFIMILFGSHYTGFFEPNPIILSSVFLIAVLYLLIAIYLEEDAFDKVFYSGFLIACASFIYFPAIFFIFFVLFTFVIYRLYKWREWVIAAMGFLTPYLFYFTWLFWFDELTETIITFKYFISSLFLLQTSIRFNILEYIIFAGLLISFLRAAFYLSATVNDNLITVRKRYWSVFWFFIVSVFIFIVSWFEGIYNPVFLIIAATIVITYYLSSLKRFFWQELILYILTLLILVHNYYSVFFTKG